MLIVRVLQGRERDKPVFIVDDDARVREALSELLESSSMRAIAFGLRIPTKPAMHSNSKPAACSDAKPAGIPT